MLQLKGSSANITTASNIGLASAVRIRATNAGNVTVAAAGGGTSNYAGVIALVADEVITLAKQPTDTITCSAAMSVVAIGYHY